MPRYCPTQSWFDIICIPLNEFQLNLILIHFSVSFRQMLFNCCLHNVSHILGLSMLNKPILFLPADYYGCTIWHRGNIYIFRDHFVYVPSQCETTLHHNIVSHWLGRHKMILHIYLLPGAHLALPQQSGTACLTNIIVVSCIPWNLYLHIVLDVISSSDYIHYTISSSSCAVVTGTEFCVE